MKIKLKMGAFEMTMKNTKEMSSAGRAMAEKATWSGRTIKTGEVRYRLGTKPSPDGFDFVEIAVVSVHPRGAWHVTIKDPQNGERILGAVGGAKNVEAARLDVAAALPPWLPPMSWEAKAYVDGLEASMAVQQTAASLKDKPLTEREAEDPKALTDLQTALDEETKR